MIRLRMVDLLSFGPNPSLILRFFFPFYTHSLSQAVEFMATKTFFFEMYGDFPEKYEENSVILLEKLVFESPSTSGTARRWGPNGGVTFLLGSTHWQHFPCIAGYIELKDAMNEEDFKVKLLEIMGTDIRDNLKSIKLSGLETPSVTWLEVILFERYICDSLFMHGAIALDGGFKGRYTGRRGAIVRAILRGAAD